MQFGDYDDQHIFEWNKLSTEDKKGLIEVMESTKIQKIGHNIMFDLVVLRYEGVYMDNIFDTQTAEKVLRAGIDNDLPSLDELAYKYCRVELDKKYQTSFKGGDLSTEQIEYAANDVKHLLPIYRNQFLQLHQHDLVNVMALENDAAIGYAEMMYEGMPLNVPYWLGLTKDTKVLLKEAANKLDQWILTDDKFQKKAIEFGFYDPTDRIDLPINTPKKIAELLEWLYPGIGGSSKKVAAAYAGKNRDNPFIMQLEAWAAGDKQPVCNILLQEHRDRLVDAGYIVPGGRVTINWNSTHQAIKVLRAVAYKIKDLSEETVAKQTHPIFNDYENFKDLYKNVSSYGVKFVDNHLNPDGKIRTSFNPVVSTGRISSYKPNMQNILANDDVGSKYRNAFYAEEGFVFVDSDYSSQELVIIAFISKDPVWNAALAKGQDLHSVCAELVFGRKWKEAAEPGCAYYKTKQKCKCKEHKKLRNAVKSINFGLAYGMSEFKLSREMGTSVPEAKALIARYFTVFPGIGRLLDYLGEFGVTNGYIMTRAPFHRKRWFPYWYLHKRYIDEHLLDIRFNGTLGAIERASKNMPIQGTAADMMKLAMCMIRWYRDDHGLRDKIRLAIQVHDQQTSKVKIEIAEWWKTKMTEIMEEAGRVFITNGLLKAETNISPLWTK